MASLITPSGTFLCTIAFTSSKTFGCSWTSKQCCWKLFNSTSFSSPSLSVSHTCKTTQHHHLYYYSNPHIKQPSQYTRAVFFSTSDRASKEVRNTREPDLRVTWLRSSPTTTSAVVGSNASVVAEVRAREHGRYDQCSRQMWVTKCNPFSASRRT